MVNEKKRDYSLKAAILALLRQGHEPVSGQGVSRELGLSRVAIWKHIKKLQGLGYPIVADSKGYRIVEAVDSLHPWEFGERASRVHFLPETVSTMELARKLAQQECPAGTIVVAERQTRGRGRMDRTWQSDPGGLYFTLVLRHRIPLPYAYRLVFAGSLALAETLSRLYGLRAEIKWPNDILVGNRKVSGILADTQVESDLLRYLNLGIGVNVNNDAQSIFPGTTSVHRILGKPASRHDILAGFLKNIERRLDTPAGDDLMGEWKSRSATLGKAVKIVTPYETINGRAVDVDRAGALIVEQSDGVRKRIICGDCLHQEGT